MAITLEPCRFFILFTYWLIPTRFSQWARQMLSIDWAETNKWKLILSTRGWIVAKQWKNINDHSAYTVMNILINLLIMLLIMFHILIDMDKILPMDLPHSWFYCQSKSRQKPKMVMTMKIWNGVNKKKKKKKIQKQKKQQQFYDKKFIIFHNF